MTDSLVGLALSLGSDCFLLGFFLCVFVGLIAVFINWLMSLFLEF